MLKRILFIALFCSSLSFAQSIDSLLAILESHQEEDQWLSLLSGEANYHLFYFQASYDNNSYFAGRDIGLDQFNARLQATYSYKQFSASLVGIFYEAFYPPLQTTALSVNYRLPIKFPIDIDLSYGRYFFSSENDTLMGSYPNSIGTTLSYTSKYWGASADLSLLAGTDGVAPQIIPSVYGNFEIFSWGKDNSFSIRPELAFYFGSELTALSSAPGTIFAKRTDGPGMGQGNGNGNGDGNNPWTNPGDGQLPSYVTVFGLLNTELNIHVIINIADLDLGFSVQNNRPRSIEAEIAYAPTSLFTLSVGYAFSFLGK